MTDSELLLMYQNIGKEELVLYPDTIKDDNFTLRIYDRKINKGSEGVLEIQKEKKKTRFDSLFLFHLKPNKIVKFQFFQKQQLFLLEMQTRSMRPINSLLDLIEESFDTTLQPFWMENDIFMVLIDKIGGEISWVELSSISGVKSFYNVTKDEISNQLADNDIQEIEIFKNRTRIYLHKSGIIELDPKSKKLKDNIISKILSVLNGS